MLHWEITQYEAQATPVGLRWALVTPERPTMWLGGWDFEPCDASLISKKGRGLEIGFNHVGRDTISHAYVMEPGENL